MNLVLNLPPELENDLSAEAERLHLSLPEYAMRLLAGQPPGERPRNGAELVAYWEREGLIGTRTDITDAEAHARAIREQAEKREHPQRMDLVDTDVLIDVQRKHPPAVQGFANLTELPAIPGFVAMELIQDARNSREIRQALKLVSPMAVVWPTENDCSRALSDFTAYHLSHNLGLLDALIAACAVGQQAVLFTFNVKHYRIVPGLNVVQPYTR